MGYMRAGRWFLELGCGGIDYGYIDVEGFGSLDELDVGTYVVGWLIYLWNDLAHYKFHTEVGLLDSRIESLEELVELIPYIIMADVPLSLIERTAESMEGVLCGVKRLLTGTYVE